MHGLDHFSFNMFGKVVILYTNFYSDGLARVDVICREKSMTIANKCFDQLFVNG
jgi:hypothetical protein